MESDKERPALMYFEYPKAAVRQRSHLALSGSRPKA